jgi:phosphatidylglycerophosphate synthase
MGTGVQAKVVPRSMPWALDSDRVPLWLYLPNLIGYVRVITLAYAIAAPDPASAGAIRCLLLSLALDFIDGPAARALRMCSQFGDLLDHFTDHATMFYLVALTTNSRVDYAINAFHCAVAFGYMIVRGHYFKHSEGGNVVTHAIEQNNYFNMPSMLQHGEICAKCRSNAFLLWSWWW